MFTGIGVSYPKRAIQVGNNTPVADVYTAVSTVAIASAGFTGTSAVGNNLLVSFDVQGCDMFVRWDGTDPTSTVGHFLPQNSAYTWSVDQFNAAKFIRASTASADGVIAASAFQ